MMFQSSPLRYSEHQRPFWLLVALAIMLLVLVSTTVAEAASPTRLLGTLQRDLGALRAQLEQIDSWHDEPARRTVASNADLGDGSPTFRRLSVATIVRAAGRHLDALVASYRDAGDDRRAELAEALSLEMYGLTERIDRLGRPASPATTVALLGEADVVLTRLEQGLAQLVAPGEATAAE
jgi:hypothetical protein